MEQEQQQAVTPESSPPVAPGVAAAAPSPDLDALQAELARVAERTRKETEKALKEQYGASPDDIRKLREKADAEAKAKMDETERAKLEAQEARERVAELERKASESERTGRIKDALRDAGLKDVSLRLALADAKESLGEEFDDKALKSYVDEVTKALAPTAPSSLPGGKPPRPASADSYEAGQEEGRKARETAQATRPIFDGMQVVARNN